MTRRVCAKYTPDTNNQNTFSVNLQELATIKTTIKKTAQKQNRIYREEGLHASMMLLLLHYIFLTTLRSGKKLLLGLHGMYTMLSYCIVSSSTSPVCPTITDVSTYTG